MNNSPEQIFFGVDPVTKRKLEKVSVQDLFTETENEMKISMSKVLDPDFETGDENAKCGCGNPAEFVTYYEEQTRFEAARIVKDGCWEVLRSKVKVNGDMSDITYYCEKCFNN